MSIIAIHNMTKINVRNGLKWSTEKHVVKVWTELTCRLVSRAMNTNPAGSTFTAAYGYCATLEYGM
jgi:hypothetical protein